MNFKINNIEYIITEWIEGDGKIIYLKAKKIIENDEVKFNIKPKRIEEAYLIKVEKDSPEYSSWVTKSKLKINKIRKKIINKLLISELLCRIFDAYNEDGFLQDFYYEDILLFELGKDVFCSLKKDAANLFEEGFKEEVGEIGLIRSNERIKP